MQHSRTFAICACVLWPAAMPLPGEASTQRMAIVGATVIDGTGAAPLNDATIVVSGQRISAIGPRATVKIPSGARVIDGTGKYVTPGFIDVNVHVFGVGFMRELFPLLLYGESDPFKKYGYALEAAQMALKFGVTTIRDTFGPVFPQLALRDAIARGEVIGPRLQVAGFIIGSECEDDQPDRLPIDRHWCNYIRGYLPVGIQLVSLYPDAVRKVINQYLDLGVDFIKYSAVAHGWGAAPYLTFSPRVQQAIVEEVHKRGKKVDVHSGTPEGHLLAADAGVDLITHAGILSGQTLSDELVQVLRERKVICALFSAWSAGPLYKLRLAEERSRSADPPAAELIAEARKQAWPLRQSGSKLPEPSAGAAQGSNVERLRINDTRMIEGGCTIAVATDAAPTAWPEVYPFRSGRADHPEFPDPGAGTILAIEGLVELGMTPSEAIVAATKHGAMAAGRLDDFGTLEVGKLADLLILKADPLADISNIRKLDRIVKEGQLIEPDTLPTRPLYYRRR